MRIEGGSEREGEKECARGRKGLGVEDRNSGCEDSTWLCAYTCKHGGGPWTKKTKESQAFAERFWSQFRDNAVTKGPQVWLGPRQAWPIKAAQWSLPLILAGHGEHFDVRAPG